MLLRCRECETVVESEEMLRECPVCGAYQTISLRTRGRSPMQMVDSPEAPPIDDGYDETDNDMEPEGWTLEPDYEFATAYEEGNMKHIQDALRETKRDESDGGNGWQGDELTGLNDPMGLDEILAGKPEGPSARDLLTVGVEAITREGECYTVRRDYDVFDGLDGELLLQRENGMGTRSTLFQADYDEELRNVEFRRWVGDTEEGRSFDIMEIRKQGKVIWRRSA